LQLSALLQKRFQMMNELKTPPNEEKRIEALRLYDILDTMPEVEFDDITRLASEICQTPIALISLVDEDRQWFKSRIGLEPSETPRDFSFCAHAIHDDAIFEINNALSDERFVNNPLVTGSPGIRFYAGAPLISKEGHRIGTLCVINSVPYSINENQKNSLRILARSVMSLLELRKEKKEADLFRKALDEVSIVSVFNANLDYEYVNDKFCDLAAMSHDEIVGKNVTEIQLADVSDNEEQQILATVRAGNIYSGTVRNLNRKGEVTWTRIILVPFMNKDAQLVKVLSLRNDITNEVMMLERMEEAENIARLGNWELDFISGKRYWSKGIYRIMDFDAEVAPPQSLSLLDMVAPEDKERLNKDLNNTIAGNDPKSISEFRVVSQKGIWKDVIVNTKKRLNSKDKLVAIYGTVQDITEKKTYERQLEESEIKYRTLVENSAQMTFTTDVEGAYTYASPHLKATIGFDDDEIIGKKFAFIHDEDWRKKTIQFYVNQLTEGIDETKFTFPINTRSGDKLWVEQTATLIRENGKITGFRCILHNITDQVRSAEAIEEAMRLATEAKEMQQNFLGRMSHEIRTPMNGVVGMVNLLGETKLDERQRIYTDSIKESAQNMLRIINDILDITKIESGKLVFEETELDVAQVVSNVIFTLKPAADSKNILIASQIDNRVPQKLKADPVRLNQVLLNLAGNAIKFTEKGSVIITVVPKVTNNSGIILEFKVVDTGIGIKKEKLATIFESFTQAEIDTTRKYGGTGLGLTIARQIVEQQLGEISVSSELGVGTTFTFTFHFKLAETDPVTNARTDQKQDLHLFSGCEILLVEDNVMNQRVAKFTLENWGVNVTIVDRGQIAIDALKTKKYDLILMDLQMPGMNGIQATIKIRQELLNDTPIIAMTASAMNSEREKCLEAGMNDYISKPFEPVELNRKIHSFVSKNSTGKKGAPRVIDMAYVNQLTNDDLQFTKDIFEIYLDRTPDSLKEIETHLADNNHILLHAEIHNLKNSVGILGARELYDLLAAAESNTLNGAPSLAIVRLLQTTIKDLVLETLEEVRQELRNIERGS